MAFEEKTRGKLESLLEKGNMAALHMEFKDLNEVDVALFIDHLPMPKAVIAFRALPKDMAMRVFSELEIETQQNVIQSISDKEVGVLINALWVDDAVDMLEEMPASLVNKVLRNSSPSVRVQINQFLMYPEGSAGSIMTPEFVALRKAMTVKKAVALLRKVDEEVETIYTLYVTDETRVLQGVVTLKDLLLSADDKTVEEIMEGSIIKVATTTGREEAAKTLTKYGFTSLPVVDAENRLVGIVTVDDAVEVLQEEDTEDFQKMAAITPSEKPYLKTSVFGMARGRFPWLLVSLLTNTITALVLGLYANVYGAWPALISFMPMLNGTGGNAGSQASTMVIRGMALGEIRTKDFFAVLWKEIRVSLLVGVVLAAINFVRLLVSHPGEYLLAGIVSFSLVGAIFVGKATGGVLPLIARACKIDPALVSTPIISTIVDILALVLYFSIAQWVMAW